MTHFYKLRSTRSPLYNLIPPERDLDYNLRMPYDYNQHIEITTRFSHTFFSKLCQWNHLDVSMRSSQTISEFKKKLSKMIRPPKRSIFNIYDLEGIKLLTQLRVEFSDLRACSITDTGIISTVQVPLVCARLELKIKSTSSCVSVVLSAM